MSYPISSTLNQNGIPLSHMNKNQEKKRALEDDSYDIPTKKCALDHAFDDLPQELFHAITTLYQPAGMKVTNAYQEKEGKDYGACRLELNEQQVVFRVAKATPKKAGHFVTVWQRSHKGAAYVPFQTHDALEFIVVSVSDHLNRGQFVFDRKVLIDQGIMGNQHKRGKGAFRVYAPWVKPTSPSALKTQSWQGRYFLSQNTPDLEAVRRLFKEKKSDDPG
ncbi:MAG: MepB family protein [Candidatus Rhabdochlamydia sp.]